MRILLGAYALTCTAILILMDAGQLTQFQKVVGSAPLGDKMMHAAIAGVLALLVNLTLLQMQPARPWRWILAGTAVTAVLCSIEEATNLFTPYRGCEALDLVANYTGILLIGLAPVALALRPDQDRAAPLDGLS